MFGVRGEVFSNFLYCFVAVSRRGYRTERRNNAERCGFRVSAFAERCGFRVFQTDLESEPGERNNAKRCEIETLCPIRVSPTWNLGEFVL